MTTIFLAVTFGIYLTVSIRPGLVNVDEVFPHKFGARLAWTHLTCIHAYQINICDDQMADCITNTTLAIDILESEEVIYETEDLVPWKTYRDRLSLKLQGDPLESVLHSCVHILGLDRLCRQLGHICGGQI